MAEPLDEQIIVQVATTLAAITASDPVGSPYWYTPDSVVRAEFSEEVNLDSLRSPLIIVRRGEVKNEPRTTSHGHGTELELIISVAQSSQQVARSPHFQTADALDQTVKSRMISDVRRALEAWQSWSSLNIISLEVSGCDYDVAMPGWSAAHTRVVINYWERLA